MAHNGQHPDSLEKARQQVLALGSLFKGSFSIDWLQELAGQKASTILAALDQGLKRGWVEQPEPGMFLFRERVADEDFAFLLPDGKRESLHRRAAGIILRDLPETTDTLFLVAEHLLEVKNDLSGCRNLIQAADIHRGAYRHEEAVRYYTKAIEDLGRLSGEDVDRLFIDAAIGYSKVSTEEPECREVVPTLRAALVRAENTDNRPASSLLSMHLAKNEWLRSRHKAALQYFQEGWALSRDIDDLKFKRSATVFGMFFHYWLGRYMDAVQTYESTVPEVERLPKSRFPLLAALTAGSCFGHTGQVTQGLGMLDAIRQHALKSDNLYIAGHCMAGSGMLLVEIGQADEAIRHFNIALDETVRGHNPFARVGSSLGLAYAYFLKHEHDACLTALREFIDLSDRTRITFKHSPYVMAFCWAMEEGRLPRLSGWSLEQEIARALRGVNVHMKGIAYRYQALLYQRQGRSHREVTRRLEKSVAWLEKSGHQVDHAISTLELARAFIREGLEDKAGKSVESVARSLMTYNEMLVPDDLRPLLLDVRAGDGLLKEILNLGQELVAIRDYKDLARRIISTVNRITGAERGAIFMIDGESSPPLILRAAKNITSEDINAPGFKHSLELIQETARTGRGRILDLDASKNAASLSGDEIRSCICVPLSIRNKLVGVLYHDNRMLRSVFRESDLEILNYFAAQAAIAMDNAQAWEALQEMYRKQKEEKQYFEEQYLESLHFEDFVGNSPAIQRVFKSVEQVSRTETTVLIRGESGAGKELVARTVHRRSPRRDNPFISVHCSALPESLITSELFGHEKGAFTGAVSRRLGRFELAAGGTLFLDEIGDIPMEVQVRLLRVLQEKSFERVGGHETLYSDFRLLAATNRDLEKEIKAGRFREDLYYRLNVFPIQVPPLRDRKEDIPLLAHYFLEIYANKSNKSVKRILESEMARLVDYDWPGNVRELENVIERGVILSRGEAYQVPQLAYGLSAPGLDGADLTLSENEKRHILRVLKRTGGRIAGTGGAAEILDVHPNTLYSRMKRLGIQRTGKNGKWSVPEGDMGREGP